MIKEKSPYNLLQEIYWPNEWQILVCCMFLNQTGRKQVDAVREEFFKTWPDAKKAAKAKPEKMKEVIKSLGFVNKRTAAIIRMSQDFIKMDWTEPKELFGIGEYGQDSYDIFVRGNIRIKNPSDHVLKKYIKWAKTNNNGKTQSR
jgi:methyl-CpG-binding domain protein 4